MKKKLFKNRRRPLFHKREIGEAMAMKTRCMSFMEHAPQIYNDILSMDENREDALFRLIDIHHIIWKDCYAVKEAGPIIGPLPTDRWFFKSIQFSGPVKYLEPLLRTFPSNISYYNNVDSGFSPESTVSLGGDYEIPTRSLFNWIRGENMPTNTTLPDNLPLKSYLTKQYKTYLLDDVNKIWEFVKRTLAQLEAYGY